MLQQAGSGVLSAIVRTTLVFWTFLTSPSPCFTVTSLSYQRLQAQEFQSAHLRCTFPFHGATVYQHFLRSDQDA